MENENFTATVADVSVTGLNKFLNAGAGIDIDSNRPEAIVKFHLDIDAKYYGIRGISVIVDSVESDINWECYDDELTEEEIATLVAAGGKYYRNNKIEGSIHIDSKDWQINSDELKFKEDGQLMVDEVYIDLMQKTITVK